MATPPFALGPRTQAMAHELVHEVAGRLALGCLAVFSSDGLALYFYAAFIQRLDLTIRLSCRENQLCLKRGMTSAINSWTPSVRGKSTKRKMKCATPRSTSG